MPKTNCWLNDTDLQAFESMRKIAFFSERRCLDSSLSDEETMLSVIDLKTYNLHAVNDTSSCKICQEVHANLADYYNESEEMKVIRCMGSTSTMLGSDRKELLVRIMQDLSRATSAPHKPEH